MNEHLSFQLTQPKGLDEHRGIKEIKVDVGKEGIVTRRQSWAVLSMARETHREQGKL